MKKTILFAAAIALAMASCGNKTQNAEAQADSTEVAADSTAAAVSEETQGTIDQLAADLSAAIETKDGKAIAATLATLQQTYAKLVEEGKIDEAKSYGEAIKKIVSDKADDIKGAAAGDANAIASLVESVKNLPTSAEATAEDAKAAAENAAKTAASDTKAAAENTVKEAGDQVKKAASDAKDNATNKVNEAKQKAKDDTKAAVNKATDKALKDLGL